MKRRKENKITIHGNIGIIHIFSKKYGHIRVAFDAEDIELINQYQWCFVVTRYPNSYYIYSKTSGKNIRLHRLIMSFPKLQVDHISGNTLDNRIC